MIVDRDVLPNHSGPVTHRRHEPDPARHLLVEVSEADVHSSKEDESLIRIDYRLDDHWDSAIDAD